MEKMIKLVYVIFIFLFLAQFLYSQERLSLIGLHSGVNYNLNYAHEKNSANFNYNLGWNYGVTFEKEVSKTLSINYQLGNIRSKAIVNNYFEYMLNSVNDTISKNIGNINIDQNYLQFSLLVRKYFTSLKRIFVEVGWDYRAERKNRGSWNLISTRYYDTASIEPIELTEPDIRTIDSKFSLGQNFLGINFGIGTRIKLSDNIVCTLSSRFNNQVKPLLENKGIHFRNFELLIGLSYILTKSESQIISEDL